MKLPHAAEAVVPMRKVRDYLLALRHPAGGPKAVFFLRHGFRRDEADVLRLRLKELAIEGDVSETISARFGTKYVVPSRGDRMMIEELAPVVLTKPLPEHGLETGDVGTVVHRYEHGDTYEVEFLTGDGRTVAVLTLERSDIRPPAEGEIFHARQVEV